jgi:type VI secretion system protein ImpL
MSVRWPASGGSNQVRLTAQSFQGTPAGTVDSGPWALWRAFDRAHIEPGSSPERFRATFEIGGRKAAFEVTAGSVRNPLRLRDLADFRCPGA